MALGGWGAFCVVVLTVPPTRFLTYLAFFVPLWLALSATGAIITYTASWKRGLVAGLRACALRSALVAGFVVLNLAAAAAHIWTLPLGIVTVLVLVLSDVSLARRLHGT